MERQPTYFPYSKVKPFARIARDHFSNPNVHKPMVSFLDKNPDPKVQLKASRRQIIDYGLFNLEKGQTLSQAEAKVKSIFEPDPQPQV